MSLFETTVLAIGSEAEMFQEEKMIILFGDNAPAELADYCYSIKMNPVKKAVEAGQILKINSSEYKITAVGNTVSLNLEKLGHITVKFDGSTTPELPGTLYVEDKKISPIVTGTIIAIQ
ncbi:MAG: PTS glucitol/sorbitol transporter subunit IIA [Enterococcus lemanii]|jgi:PTS system glucitol/sorbitol-specific IIA component